MDASAGYPQHQKETEWEGDVQFFSGPAYAPDDPRLEPRVRKGRPPLAPPTEPDADADMDQNTKS